MPPESKNKENMKPTKFLVIKIKTLCKFLNLANVEAFNFHSTQDDYGKYNYGELKHSAYKDWISLLLEEDDLINYIKFIENDESLFYFNEIVVGGDKEDE